MNTRHRWIIVVGALLLAGVVGFIAYNTGFSQGIEQSGKIVTAPAGAPPYYWHHHHWGFGWFAPLFFFFIWLFAFRAFRGHHHHHCRYEENHPRS